MITGEWWKDSAQKMFGDESFLKASAKCDGQIAHVST
jgi:hypothetical protein